MFLVANADTYLVLLMTIFLNTLCEKYDTVFYSNIIEISQISFCWVCKGARIFIFMNLLMPMALIIARVHSI